ncbi:MAG: NAD(P)-binding domain-containing protein [Verrucomicrobiae bacterium]|nr:NAD(P)-binding domain-containing protein [Verrucomicrobiae bacterium]
MVSLIQRYTRWLHTQWPAGRVEKLPEVGKEGKTSVPGVRMVGDLTGIPLLKFSLDSGARAVKSILAEPDFAGQRGRDGILDLAIIGGGVSGYAAAIEAQKAGLNFKVYEAVRDFATVANFPRKKPIYTYPTDMTPKGDLQVSTDVKEALLQELEDQRNKYGVQSESLEITHLERKQGRLLLHASGHEPIAALRVIVAIGRSGNFRKLNVPGEDLDKVFNRLHDPGDFTGKRVLVVGGGDSALESAIALRRSGADVTLSYRRADFARPKAENVEQLNALEGEVGHGSLRLCMASQVRKITERSVTLQTESGNLESLENDAVFVMIGREAPLDFFRRSNIRISGEWHAKTWVGLLGFFAFCCFVYHWKSGGVLTGWWQGLGWFPFNLGDGDSRTLSGSIVNAARDPGFYYSLVYTLCIVLFGIKRIRRRKTAYVKRQTLTLMAFQVVPLFLLPYILLPWMGNNGIFDVGVGRWLGDAFFPDGSYWRAFGFILAWPLFLWNVFTDQPIWGWLIVSLIQTFVIIPWIVRRWGKGAYCGWVCSCGALAETMGDTHRHKMPHGPAWNRLNMIGQGVLAAAFLLLILRVLGWVFPGNVIGQIYEGFLSKYPIINYKYIVDLWFAGILGVAFYFHFSGRVWCRFACPLAALMHVYARFSQFRIFADKKKCISCNVCTSVCHQGIDVMAFANKGLPMEDPECVRCSACVQSCPTAVLSFGRYTSSGNVYLDAIPASPVLPKENSNSLSDYLKEVKGLSS